ncbi:MAG: hypothetical protein AAGF84_15225 [Planctomycetota bacterium]
MITRRAAQAACGAAWAFVQLAPAAAAADFSPIVVNGGTDADINAAIQLAERATHRTPPKVGGSTWSVQAPLVVLRGVFDVRAPIRMPAALRIRAEGAVLNCRALPPEAFAFDGVGWRCEIAGSMSLVAAPNGIRWNTGTLSNNLTLGMSRIEGVHFAGVRGVAIDLQCRSSVVVIERCIFDSTSKVLHDRMCDDVAMVHCFVSGSRPPSVTPITLEYGRLTIRGGVFTPSVAAKTAAMLSWIEIVNEPPGATSREQMLLCDGVRFGGEFGGIAVVTNRAAGRTNYPGGPGVCITLRNLHASNTPNGADRSAAGEATGPLVLLEKVPNHVLIEGCYGVVKPSRLVDFLPGVDAASLVSKYSTKGIHNRFTLHLQRHNTLPPGSEAPPELQRFVVGPAAELP